MGIGIICIRLSILEKKLYRNYFFFANGDVKFRILPSSNENFAWGLILLDSADIVVLVHEISDFYDNLNNSMIFQCLTA